MATIDTSFDMFIETIVPHNELIISRTDLKGVITYVNETFAEISGYKPEELIGKPHNIVRHPDMPKSVYADLWKNLKEKESWSGYVKNMRKDRGYYWVHAHISGVYKDGELVEYKSIREPMDRPTKIEMQNLYDQMREKEENSCRVVLYTTCDRAKELGG
jgi:aerotaxis receptor